MFLHIFNVPICLHFRKECCTVYLCCALHVIWVMYTVIYIFLWWFSWQKWKLLGSISFCGGSRGAFLIIIHLPCVRYSMYFFLQCAYFEVFLQGHLQCFNHPGSAPLTWLNNISMGDPSVTNKVPYTLIQYNKKHALFTTLELGKPEIGAWFYIQPIYTLPIKCNKMYSLFNMCGQCPWRLVNTKQHFVQLLG